MNPKEIVMRAIGNSNNPMLNNLVKMAQNNDYKGLEQFARNMFKEQGRNFDEELKHVKEYFQNFK